jgi:predicted RNA-binding Zn-ribbon protein involved in translation (DUF1610 family)
MASYCSKCGKELDEGVRFCPSCGFDTMGQSTSNNNSSYNQNYNAQNNNQSQGMGGTLTVIFVLGIIWGILSVISGILLVMGGGAFAFLFEFGAGLFIIIGILSFLSGLFAILCCINIYKLEKFDQARTFCLIGSIIAFVTGGIIAGIIGIIFYFIMRDQKSRFKS